MIPICIIMGPLLAQDGRAQQSRESDAEARHEKKLRHRKVVISASRTETQLADSVVQVEVITKEEIRNRGARTVSDVLNNQTGFFIQRSTISGDNVQIQGLDSTYILILRDGERLNGRLNGNQYDLSRLRVENIERIEIVRGSASAVYGSDAIAGVINIVTRQPDKPRAELRIQGGNLGQFDTAAAVSAPAGDFGFKAAGGYRTQQPFRYNESSIATNGRGIVDYSGEGGIEYNISRHWVTAVQGDYQRRRLWGTDTPSSGGIYDRTNLTETAQAAFRLHTRSDAATEAAAQIAEQNAVQRDDNKLRKELGVYSSKIAYRLNGSYTTFRDQYLYDQRNDTAQDALEETRENTYVAHTQVGLPLWSGARLVIGGEGFFENMRTPRIRANPQEIETSASATNTFVERHRLSGYTQLETHLTHSLILTPGVRYDHDSQFGDFVSPRIGLKWGNEDFIVRASAGLGYRAPSFRELYLYFENPSAGYRVEGNPNLKPEQSRSANLGTEIFLSNRLSLDSNAYYNELTNLIQTGTRGLSGGTAIYQYTNVATAITAGVDNRLSYFVNRYLKATLGYSLTYAYDRSVGRLLQGRSLHRGHVGLLVRYKGLMLRGMLSLIDRMPYYLTDTATTPDAYTARYWTADVNAEYSIGAGLSLFAGGENINSAGDATFMPLAPARYYGGARYIFGE
jgi:outer membrane receptor for ferrienterochelin and colicins